MCDGYLSRIIRQPPPRHAVGRARPRLAPHRAQWEAVASPPGGRGTALTVSRKVGTPQGRTLARARQGDLTESATESRPPMGGPPGPSQARVKRCGKSAPAPRATGVACKPRPEQGQVWVRVSRPGSRKATQPLVGRRDGWSPRRREALDRIPPTGGLATAPPQGRPQAAGCQPGRRTTWPSRSRQRLARATSPSMATCSWLATRAGLAVAMLVVTTGLPK